MNMTFEGIGADIFEQELAAESAVRRLFALTRRRYRELRREQDLSQQELAERMGLKPTQISRWFANPSNMTLRSAAKLLMAMGRKLELGLSDPFALVQAGGEKAPAALAPAPANVVDIRSRQKAGTARHKTSGRGRLLLAAAPHSHGSGKARAAPEPKAVQLGKPVASGSGIGVFNEVDRRVQFVAVGASPPTRLRLGEADLPLKPMPLSPNVFELPAEVKRAEILKLLRQHERSPEDRLITWE